MKLFLILLIPFILTGFTAAGAESPRDKFIVVLDAGHGGEDPGNRGNGYYEKTIALNIVLSIGRELEKLPDVKVIYTRKSDVFVPLAERAEIANEAEAHLFISVHCNSHSSQASGTETFVLGLSRSRDNMEVAKRENSVIYLEEDYEVTYNGFDPESPESQIGMTLMQEEYLDQSILLADLIQKNFTNKLKRKNRGVKQAIFLVLRETYMPSVLVETGFLTNNYEGAYLNSNKGQGDMSGTIVEAVKSYKNSLNLDLFKGYAPAQQSESTGDLYEGITFKVQVAASKNKLDLKPYNFKGLKDLSRSREDNMFKYYYGATSSYSEVKQLQETARKTGYPSSFVVAFKKGKKIDVKEALKTKVN